MKKVNECFQDISLRKFFRSFYEKKNSWKWYLNFPKMIH